MTYLHKRYRFIPANTIVALLTLSDIFTWGLVAVLNVLVGIFLAEKLGANTVQIVGIGTAILAFSRGVIQIPAGKFVDKHKGDTDEITALALGNILMGIVYILFPTIETAGMYYVLQLLFGIGTGINLVGWRKLMTQNVDRQSEGMEYAEYGLVIDVSIGIFGLLAGTIANFSQAYFELVLVLTGFMMILSSIFPVMILMVRYRNSKNK
jgi:MFS family permease